MVSRRGCTVAGTGKHAKLAARQSRRTIARERRALGQAPLATVPPERLQEEARRCARSATVAEEVDLRRVEVFAVAAMGGVRPELLDFRRITR